LTSLRISMTVQQVARRIWIEMTELYVVECRCYRMVDRPLSTARGEISCE
jgi:hypothetical protein